jgi:hypothetical protein
MDPVVVFDTYLERLASAGSNWTTDTVKALLVSRATWAPDRSDEFVGDATGAGAVEVTASGYARQTIGSPAVNVDGSGHRALLAGATIDFGTPDAGSDFDTLIIYTQVTNDADSWMLAAVDLGSQTTAGVDISAVPDADGFFALAQPAP